MWDAWLQFDGFCKRAKYCDSDNFNMFLHSDWEACGMQEVLDSLVSFAYLRGALYRLRECRCWTSIKPGGRRVPNDGRRVVRVPNG
jgi:hypothetical protein